MFMHATVENYVLRRRYMYVEIERTPLPRTIFHASDNSYPEHDFFSFWCSHKISPWKKPYQCPICPVLDSNLGNVVLTSSLSLFICPNSQVYIKSWNSLQKNLLKYVHTFEDNGNTDKLLSKNAHNYAVVSIYCWTNKTCCILKLMGI